MKIVDLPGQAATGDMHDWVEMHDAVCADVLNLRVTALADVATEWRRAEGPEQRAESLGTLLFLAPLLTYFPHISF